MNGGSVFAEGSAHRMAYLCALRHGAFRGNRVARASACTAGFVTRATMRALSEFNRRWLHGNVFNRRQGSSRARDCHGGFPVLNTGRTCIAEAVHDAVRHPSILIAVRFFRASRLTAAPPVLQSP